MYRTPSFSRKLAKILKMRVHQNIHHHPRLNLPVLAVLHFNPKYKNGSKNTNPAIGPARPTSKRARLFGNGDLILMKAPKVPVITPTGAGIKKASVALIP